MLNMRETGLEDTRLYRPKQRHAVYSPHKSFIAVPPEECLQCVLF